jgi:hypothetical protein
MKDKVFYWGILVLFIVFVFSVVISIPGELDIKEVIQRTYPFLILSAIVIVLTLRSLRNENIRSNKRSS